MNAPRPEPVQLLIELPESHASPAKEELTWEMRAWLARKKREREGRPLTLADREQVTRMLEDQGCL